MKDFLLIPFFPLSSTEGALFALEDYWWLTRVVPISLSFLSTGGVGKKCW